MSSKRTPSYLCIVGMADYEEMIDNHGTESAKLLREEFFRRIKLWTRPSDQSNVLRDSRFLVLLKGLATQAQLELATAKLKRLFNEPYNLFGQAVSINVHAGFVLLDSDTTSISQTEIQRARKALRQAIQKNSLYVIFDEGSHQNIDQEKHLIRALESAVANGEFRLYYQPKIHPTYGTLVGAEALMRWHTSDGKVLTPFHFIDVAEKNDVIRPMTWWAIKSVVSQLARWPQQPSLSVNLPPTLLMDDEVVSIINDSLDIYGVEPSRLTLEVTENIMITNPDMVLSKLAQLQATGIKISIDDFGTGFSSLAYFRDLPVNELKIDKSFVLKMLDSKKDLIIVKTVIDLAHNFSLSVVAEGVETKAVAEKLNELGCDQLQGFFFDQALQINDYEKRYFNTSSSLTPYKNKAAT